MDVNTLRHPARASLSLEGSMVVSGRNRTDMGGERGTFLTTHWSLIEGIRAGDDKGHALIGSLLENYWKPVYCYLQRRDDGSRQTVFCDGVRLRRADHRAL